MIRKTLLFIPMLTALSLPCLNAQQVDFDKVVQPLEAKARDFSEYLVQLAWQNNPEAAIVQAELLNARDESKNIRKEWTRDLAATFNINEANVRATNSNSNIFFPRYNVGATINVFDVLSQKGKNKISKREVEIAAHKINERKLQIRTETLSRYANYKLAKAVLQKRSLAEQDIYASYILVQQLYKTDEKTLEDYTAASKLYYQAQEDRLKAETDVLLAKYQLEEMIGVKWEGVVHVEKGE